MPQILLLIYAVLVTILLIYVFVTRQRRQTKKFYEYQDRIVKAQMEEMNQMYLTMRGWRHDYHNHMQTIKAHLAMGQMQEALTYIDQMAEELESIDFKYKSGNLGVDAILNSKLELAEQRDIAIKCDASVPNNLNINPVDLCVLLGNLIDNAIEACEKRRIGEPRFLRIYICMMKQQLYLSVSNSTSEVIRKLDSEYISKKRGNHGNGLKRINLIVEKYKGYINRKNEPGVFVTEINLPVSIIEK